MAREHKSGEQEGICCKEGRQRRDSGLRELTSTAKEANEEYAADEEVWRTGALDCLRGGMKDDGVGRLL